MDDGEAAAPEEGDGHYEEIDWASDFSGAPNLLLGSEIYVMLVGAKDWVNRRVEKVRFVNESTALRSISLDFLLPSSKPGFSTSAGHRLIPLSLLRKRPLRSFDVRDETGAPLPLLTREQNGWVAWSTLVALSQFVTEEAGLASPLPSAISEDLRSIAIEHPDDATTFLGRMWDWDTPSGHHREVLMEDDGTRDLIEDLAEKFLLIVPVEDSASKRRIVKFRYLFDIEPEKITLAMRLAWDPTPVSFEVPAVDEAASYHCEVECPRGLTIHKAALRNEKDGEVLTEVRHPGEVAHLYATGVPDGTSGKARVWLHAQTSGLLRSSMPFCLLVVALLTVLFVDLLQVQRPATTGVLLTLPGVVSLFIVRPGEHLLVSRLLITFRSLVVAVGFLPFVGAVLLSLTSLSEVALLWCWYALIWFGAMGSYAVTRAYIRAARAEGLARRSKHVES